MINEKALIRFPSAGLDNISDYAKNYFSLISLVMENLNMQSLERAVLILKRLYSSNHRLFVCGNGGSAAIANHLICDHQKLIAEGTNLRPNIVSLSANVNLITAIANDISFEDIFSYQVYNNANKNDVLLAISSSGNSKNIVKVIEASKDIGMISILMSGFDGGKASRLADIVLHAKVANYGIIEDVHHVLMHVLGQYIKYSSLEEKHKENGVF